VSPEEAEELAAAGRAAGQEAPPLTPAQADYLNALFRAEMNAIRARTKESEK